MFFRGFFAFLSKTAKSLKVNKTLRGRIKFEGRLLKKHENFTKKLPKNDANLRSEKGHSKKLLKNLIWEGLGLNFGRGLGRSGLSFRRSWAHFLHVFGFFSYFFGFLRRLTW